ncbi:PHLOEM PROTEIN 2 A3, partial [Biomphalaria glabrata]
NKTQPKIKILLLGKVGAGKSATGNSLSGRVHFDSSNCLTNETISVSKHSEKDVDGYTLVIYDTQGLMDSDLTELTSAEEMMENMRKLIRSSEEISVFLLVYNIAAKFSQDDQKCVSILETTFGKEEFYKRCILVITKGDHLDEDFKKWLNKQEKHFEQLLNKCNGRAVLMCNKISCKEKYEETRQTLIDEILKLNKSSITSYNLQVFMKYEKDRVGFLLDLEMEKSGLKESYEKEIKDIQTQASCTQTYTTREKIMQEIAVLRNNIKIKDNGTGKLKVYLDRLDALERNLPSVRPPDPVYVTQNVRKKDEEPICRVL